MSRKIKIKYLDKVYEIDRENIDYIISKLEGSKQKYSEKEIFSLMEKYELFDVGFLNNINKLK